MIVDALFGKRRCKRSTVTVHQDIMAPLFDDDERWREVRAFSDLCETFNVHLDLVISCHLFSLRELDLSVRAYVLHACTHGHTHRTAANAAPRRRQSHLPPLHCTLLLLFQSHMAACRNKQPPLPTSPIYWIAIP